MPSTLDKKQLQQQQQLREKNYARFSIAWWRALFNFTSVVNHPKYTGKYLYMKRKSEHTNKSTLYLAHSYICRKYIHRNSEGEKDRAEVHLNDMPFYICDLWTVSPVKGKLLSLQQRAKATPENENRETILCHFFFDAEAELFQKIQF